MTARQNRIEPPEGAAKSAASDSKSAYNPAIDGLRAFAVSSVVLFHLVRSVLPGGFVGVDVFFVISGFLITGILVRGSEQGPKFLWQFYQNRIARIAPAGLLTIVATLLGGLLIYDGQSAAYLGSAALFAATSLINFKLIFQPSYFALSPDTQPLLHFWSLAVEEQYYLVFPLLILAIRRLAWSLGAALIIIGLVSFALALVLSYSAPSLAFYLLPTRAWELAAGGWLAIAAQPRWLTWLNRGARSWLGMALLALAFAAVSEARAFPGLQALLPVAATLLLLDAVRSDAPVARMLTYSPLVWLGLRSYSLYLWHWPVFSLCDYAMFRSSELVRIPIKVALTLAFTILSYKFFEQPMRRALREPKRRVLVFVLFVLATGSIAVAGWQIRESRYLSAEGWRLAQGGTLVNPDGNKRVVLIGDSEAAMYATALAHAAPAAGWRLRLLGAAATNELDGDPSSGWPEVARWLDAESPAVIIVAQAWSSKLGDGVPLERLLSRAATRGERVIILLQPPRPFGKQLTRADFARDQPLDLDNNRQRDAANRKIRAIAARYGTLVLDPSAMFMGPGGTVRFASGDGSGPLEYYDPEHLSETGAERVTPMIIAAIASDERAP